MLTGGTSRRLGFDKATVLVGAETLAVRAARVLAAACAPVIEVGPGHCPIPSVREEPAGAGPLAALVAGADALEADSVVLLASDLVRVESPLLVMLAEWEGAPTVVPVVDGRAQLVCARYGPDALAVARTLLANGEHSLRAVLNEIEADAVTPADRPGVMSPDTFVDLDTPDDLARLGLRAPG